MRVLLFGYNNVDPVDDGLKAEINGYKAFLITKTRKPALIMETKELKRSKAPEIIVDKSLNKLRGKEYFPEKLKIMNEILAKSGLPDLNKLK